MAELRRELESKEWGRTVLAATEATRLDLIGKNIGDDGVTLLARWARASGSMANLQMLWLSGNQIGDAGMSAFAGAIASGSLANLEQMSLFENQIGDAGMIEFSRAIASGSLASLKKRMVLDVEKNLLHYTEAVHYTEVGLGLGG